MTISAAPPWEKSASALRSATGTARAIAFIMRNSSGALWGALCAVAALGVIGCSSGPFHRPDSYGEGGSAGGGADGQGASGQGASPDGGAPSHTTTTPGQGGSTTTGGGGDPTTTTTSTSTNTSTTTTTPPQPSEACAGTVPQEPGCYWEPVCPHAPLDNLAASYSSGQWLGAALEATNRRYPSANCLFSMYQNDVGNFADTWGFDPLCESMMTMMHEETHGYDYEHALGGDHFSYFIRCDLSLETPWIDAFPRSEILPLVEGSATDLYDGTYLTGTQGTYGWVELLDEWNAYLNGMAAIGLVGDHVPAFGISGTDGALAFAYYAELYLRVARTSHPSDYAAIKGDPAFQELLRLQWNRMHFFLALADEYPKLSIEADAIRQLVYAPANQAELEKVIGPLSANACN